MNAKIYAKVKNSAHQFFLDVDGKKHYLFQQDYRRGVDTFFSKSVRLDTAIDFSRCHRDKALMRTMEKILMYIKYVEKQDDIAVLGRTIRKKSLCVA